MSRPDEILTEALGELPDDVVNEVMYRMIMPELNTQERDELALKLFGAIRELHPETNPDTVLSTLVLGIAIGRGTERLHQAGRL